MDKQAADKAMDDALRQLRILAILRSTRQMGI
ncbi:hypothetical protein P792_00435 [Asaia sp. SF2.1]|nr:hypothetical protein P792_00435 [Asaia sp. SF2.1]